MNGQSLTSAAWGFKNGLFEAAVAVMPTGVYVAMGEPQTLDPSQIVSIGLITVHQSPAALSTNRDREEVLTCEVTFSVYQGGMDDAEQAVTKQAFDLAGLLEQQVHYIQNGTDGTLLGGVVRECFMTDMREDTTAVAVANQTTGRESVVIATFTGKARVKWNPQQ